LPSRVTVTATSATKTTTFEVRLRIDTVAEAEYFRNGGVLNFVLRQLARS
jgi:aconitate hydratase